MSWWLCPPDQFAQTQRLRQAEMNREIPSQGVQRYLDQVEQWDERENLALPTPRTLPRGSRGAS